MPPSGADCLIGFSGILATPDAGLPLGSLWRPKPSLVPRKRPHLAIPEPSLTATGDVRHE